MNVPILLHHLRNASGIVVRVQTEVEFLQKMFAVFLLCVLRDTFVLDTCDEQCAHG